MPDEALPTLRFRQGHVGPRSRAEWSGLAVELLPTADDRSYEFVFDGPAHYLCFGLAGRRKDSVVEVDGLRATTFLEVRDRFHVVPAGATFRGFSAPAGPQRFVQVYLDARGGALHPDLDLRELAPRLAAEHAALTATARKLEAAAAAPGPLGRLYGETLGCVLGLELLRWQRGAGWPPPGAPPSRGGLAPRRLRKVTDYVEDHLADEVSLATLAGLAGLSPWHFCRAFRQSTGLPPHRWQVARRVERAKALLAEPSLSVTDVALAVGFGGSTQFARTFRRLTGVTPSAWRARLG